MADCVAKITSPMLHAITTNITPREHIASVTSKGQITIPAHVRNHLKLDKHHKVAVLVNPDGSVQLKVPKYPTLESIVGAVEPLAKPLTMQEMRELVKMCHAGRRHDLMCR